MKHPYIRLGVSAPLIFGQLMSDVGKGILPKTKPKRNMEVGA